MQFLFLFVNSVRLVSVGLVTDNFAILADHPYITKGSSNYKLDHINCMLESSVARRLIHFIIVVLSRYFASQDVLWKMQIVNR
jgi:hypothetical protein